MIEPISAIGLALWTAFGMFWEILMAPCESAADALAAAIRSTSWSPGSVGSIRAPGLAWNGAGLLAEPAR